MKKTKKITAFIALGVFLLVSALPAFAAEVVPIIAPPQKMPHSVVHTIEVSETLKLNSGSLAIVGTNEDGILWQFNLSDETLIIDNETGLPADESAIKIGDKVQVIASPISTRSIPPQSPAIVVLTNLGEKVPAIYFKVEEIQELNAGRKMFFEENGDFVLTLDKDSVIRPLKTKNIVKFDELKKGSELLVWSEIMTLSLPAHLMPEMIVLLPERVAEEDAAEMEFDAKTGALIINGVEQKLSAAEKPYQKTTATWMLPVRRVFDALGYTVNWQAESRTIELEKGSAKASLTLGNKGYKLSEDAKTVEVAPELKNGISFAPEAMIRAIIGK